MRQYKLHAIVIKNYSLGDADKFFTVFSREKGKVLLKAKGVRKIKSKLASHLESLNLVTFDVAQGRGKFDVITGAISEKSFKEIKLDLDKIAVAYFFLELIDKLMAEGQKNDSIFSLLNEVLNLLNSLKVKDNKDYFFDILEASFIYNLIKKLGHKPRIDVCVICGSKYEDKNLIFDFEQGGIICNHCKEHKINSKTVSFESLKIINALDKISFKDTLKIISDHERIKEAKNILRLFNYFLFQKEYKSKRFVDEIHR